MTGKDSKVWRRNEPDSPCQAVCLIDPATRFCLGCNRTADEIAGWSRMSPESRAALRLELPNRSAPRAKRKGGRTRRMAEREDPKKDV